jgi:hypothetical protein
MYEGVGMYEGNKRTLLPEGFRSAMPNLHTVQVRPSCW